jgi:predicted HTH domain antitoxin
MATNEFTVRIPDEMMAMLHASNDEVASTVRMAAAVKLYEMGRLSSGAAAELAGVPRTVFLSELADYGVSTFDLTEAELREDLARA